MHLSSSPSSLYSPYNSLRNNNLLIPSPSTLANTRGSPAPSIEDGNHTPTAHKRVMHVIMGVDAGVGGGCWDADFKCDGA